MACKGICVKIIGEKLIGYFETGLGTNMDRCGR